MKKRSNGSPGSRSTWFIATMLIVFSALLTVPQAHATQSFFNSFSAKYPESSSDENAGCALCHGSAASYSTFNEYGWLFLQNGKSFAALEAQDSVNIFNCTTVLDEIKASTQPGWTTGDGNNLYQKDGTLTKITAPNSITGNLDPVNCLPVADAGGPYTGIAGDSVSFDGSGSIDPDGTIASYDWDFGDNNTAFGVNPTHAYAAPGTYTVSLTVTDEDGAKDTDSTTAEIVPAPELPNADPGGPYKGVVGTALTFDGSGSSDPDGGTITQYDWDFGDGEIGTGVAPTHAYDKQDTYTVTLTVVDDEGDLSEPATTTAEILVPQVPVADPGDEYKGVVGIPVTFDGSGSYDPDGGDITEYNWDFGDDTTGTGETPTHVYTEVDEYVITLVVKDDEGVLSEAATTTVVIDLPQTRTSNGGCSIGGRGLTDPTLPLLVLVALLYVTRRRTCTARICDQD